MRSSTSPTAARVLRVLATVAALAFVLPPSVALADCMAPPSVQEAVETADIVFLGTVTQTSNHDSWAAVAVDEVWRGPDQPATVVVRGGPAGNMATSVDRAYKADVTYLFFPYADETGALADNSCTNTVEWSVDLAPLRPEGAREPIGATQPEEGFDVGGLVAPLGVAVLVGGALLLAGLAARGRNA
jgi:hypothetical protein